MSNASEVEEANAAEKEEVSIEMEELKLDDSKEEDMLGAQSLLMSDSEEEQSTVDAMHSRKISPKRAKHGRIADSDDDEEQSQPGLDTTEEKLMAPAAATMKLDHNDETDVVGRVRKKIAAIVDTDSEDDENVANPRDFNEAKTKVSALTDSETEEKTDGNELNNDLKRNKLNLTKKNEKSKIKDSDDSEEEQSLKHENEEQDKKTKFSALVDSESEPESDAPSEAELEDDVQHESNHTEEKMLNYEEMGGKKKPKPMRVAAKKALDEMQAIQSEQQRMHREAHLSIPYHKPKRHTLQEFLKRRTIANPQLQPKGTFPPMQTKSLKMNAEELEAYAKLMEERAKEATEFFKSESDEDEFKDNEDVLEPASQVPENLADELATIETMPQAEEPIVETITDELFEENSNLSLDNEKQLAFEADDIPTISGVIITEVLELPRLDISTLCANSVTTPDAALTPKMKNSESLRRLITEKMSGLTESRPSLHGDSNMLIDLETGDLIAKQPTGVDNLLERLMLSSKARKTKTSETLNILSTENGKLEISQVNVNLAEKANTKEQKPGAAYFKLQENLKSIITKKRREDMQKKQEEEQEYRKCLDDDDDDEEGEDENDEYEPETKPKMNDIVIDEEENAINDDDDILETDDIDENEEEEEKISTKNYEETAIDIDDDENAEEDNMGDNENEEDEEEEDEDDLEELVDDNENGKRKNRIIRAFQDDSDDENDFIKPQFTASAPKSTTAALFDTEVRGNHSDEENELLDLCSGQFGDTQQPPATPIISQMPIKQVKGHDEVEEIKELCSGAFETQNEGVTGSKTQPSSTQSALKSRKILSSDEEEKAEAEAADTQKRLKKLTKKLKKKKPKLGFSDDEDETEDEDVEKEVDEASDTEDAAAQQVEEVPETFIDYDSEENEIVVQMTKKDCVAQAQKFFENEAELSESEWGSADEDEKHMDKYDIELGDEDEFDREKIRAELGQIHARKMLDEDIREVRKLQDMLFEDEEKDGVGRQRQFKWKNVENGFSLDDSNRPEMGEGGENAGGSGDEENEHIWRKIRYEREQLLQEQSLKENSQDLSSSSTILINTTSLLSSSTTKSATAASTAKKINIITAKKTFVSEKKSSPFLISKNSSTVHTKTVRGSFLVRGRETLTKLAAGLTKGNNAGNNTADRTAGTVSTKVIKPKNFVFATLTEEEHEHIKRKAEDLMNSSNENGINYMKKPKLEPRRDKCLIDQLL